MSIPIAENFVVPDAPYGFLCYCEEWGVQDSTQKDYQSLHISRLNNHALASTQNHAIVNLSLDQIPRTYESYNEPLVEKRDENDELLYTVSCKYFKRNRNLEIYKGGRQLTIDASGPSVIKKAIGIFVADKNIKDFSGFSFPLIARGDDIMIVMPNIQSYYANTRLGSGAKKAHEFEDLSVSTSRKPFRP